MRAASWRRRIGDAAAILALAAGGLSARAAHAAPPDPAGPDVVVGEDRKRADELFQEGRRLMREGRAAEACPLLALSQEIEPAGGTLLNLSRCYESLGRFASADRVLVRALQLGREKGRADAIDFIEAERTRIASAIDHVVIIKSELPPNAEITLDGVVVAERSTRIRIDIDPGRHEITVRAPDHDPAELSFELPRKDDLEGRSVEVRVPSLRASSTGAPPLAPKRPAKPDVRRQPAPDAASSDLATLGTVAVIGGGVLVGVGIVFGAVAASTWSSVEERCPTRRCSDPGARSDADGAAVAAGLSTGFILGGLGLGGVGVGLHLASPSADAPADRRAQLTYLEAF